MKYNSIGEQLIAKAKELDPNYKPDKFNDMSEALDVILKTTGSAEQSIEDLPVIELTSETTTITDETVKAKILENVNKDNYLICKLKMTSFEILITRDFKLAADDTFDDTVFTQTVFINLGIVAGSLVFTLSINSKDGTIAVSYEMLDYIKGRQIALIQPTNESFGVTADYGDTNLINGLELYFDTINEKPIIHSDNTVNSYTFTEDKTISLFGKYSILVPKDSADINILPLPSDASTKTYTLKAVNGVLTWVEG